MLKIFLLNLALLAISCNSHCQTIDSQNSKVSFSVSNLVFNTVKGTFSGMNGEIIFNPDNLSSSNFEVCINVSSINTGNKKRDNHLRNEDFFDVDNHPEICFSSSQIIKTDTAYKTTGTLSMHGVTKTIDIPFTFTNNQLIGDFKVMRLDYNVGEGTGNFSIGKEIDIQIMCILN